MGLPLVIERTKINIQYPMAVMAPIRDTPTIEFRLGSWATSIATHVNTKNHSVLVNDWTWHVASWSHMVLNKRSKVRPPLIIIRTQAPPDEYITGNNASNFPNFGPAYNSTLLTYISWLLNTFVICYLIKLYWMLTWEHNLSHKSLRCKIVISEISFILVYH